MAQRIRAAHIADHLDDAGHTPSEWDGIDWDPGYRIVQQGPRRVHAFHDGPAEEYHITLYTRELRSLGYSVVEEQQDRGGRRRLIVTKEQ